MLDPRHALAAAALALLAPGCFAAAPEPLPLETMTVEKLPPPDAYRLYVGDPTMGHLVDGRSHVIDTRTMRYLGMLGTGFAGSSTLSRDGRSIYVATTYHSRLQRGARTDVVEIYGSEDLALKGEIEIPPKHVQSLPIKALLATTSDDRFLLVQNATPATSVTVVDMQARKVTAEIPLPGCYGVIAWPGDARRFSAVCGDGTMMTVTLDEQGNAADRKASAAFFDPDTDPVFMHYELVGETLRFVSYHGTMHEIALKGEQPAQIATWPLITAAAEKKQKWAPSGYQLFTIDPRTQRLYVAMHDHAKEGSHKTPAKELWVYDLAAKKRVARWPGQMAISMTMLPTEPVSRLVLLSGADNKLLAYDLRGDAAPKKPTIASEPVGETPVYLGVKR
ncbi:amine dehydrogenase large subunit [Pelomonas sp. KK5]|uniref:amine dehydrogenase large subunit n=1 Tax=Pelomonas sp. KK5 TaxID=1855730 RepID=UPI00097BEB56|nr:amine dehydrogenase large subunit [Pelomonas sp. KK5]